MIRTASARWNGKLRDGAGSLSSASGVLADTPYSFSTRFADGAGTNPEELIAAAHAGCFSMALSGQLEAEKLAPERIDTTASLTMEKLEAGWTVTAIHLAVKVKLAEGADTGAFMTAANKAKDGCPISRLLNAKITMEASVV